VANILEGRAGPTVRGRDSTRRAVPEWRLPGWTYRATAARAAVARISARRRARIRSASARDSAGERGTAADEDQILELVANPKTNPGTQHGHAGLQWCHPWVPGSCPYVRETKTWEGDGNP